MKVLLPTLTALAVAALTSTAVAHAATEPSAPPLSPEMMANVSGLAEEAVSALVDDTLATNKSAFLDTPAGGQGSIDKVSTTDSVVDVMSAQDSATADLARATEGPGGIKITDVSVQPVKAPTMSVAPDGTVTASVDIEIVRGLAGESFDWIEVVPHVFEIDPAASEVTGLTVLDLNHHLDNPVLEPTTDNRLMRIPNNEPTADPTALTSTQKQKVVDYALKYAINRNTSYKDYSGSGGDCTNFISQAMFAGGWTERSDGIISYKSDKSWWYGGVPTASWTWTGAENFYRMTRALGRTTMLGRVYDLRKGDLLQYKNKTSTSMNHSMVVTAKRSTDGMPYLSYHTTNTKNRPFSAMSSLNVYWFAHRT